MLKAISALFSVAVSAALLTTEAGSAQSVPPTVQPAGHITGLGGVFVRSKDPKALAIWYRDVLGLDVKAWGGAMLRYDAPGHPPMALWSAFAPDSDEMAGSTREFMIDFAVDDMDAFVARLTAKGASILKREQDATGKFAWILDPDGTKIELWQPN